MELPKAIVSESELESIIKGTRKIFINRNSKLSAIKPGDLFIICQYLFISNYIKSKVNKNYKAILYNFAVNIIEFELIYISS